MTTSAVRPPPDREWTRTERQFTIRTMFPRRHIAALLIWQAALAVLWLAGYAR